MLSRQEQLNWKGVILGWQILARSGSDIQDSNRWDDGRDGNLMNERSGREGDSRPMTNLKIKIARGASSRSFPGEVQHCSSPAQITWKSRSSKGRRMCD